MRSQYYKLPIRFGSIFETNGGTMPTCTEIESIDQHIELLLTTCPGEHKFNKAFGCRIWDMDFERVVSRQKWEDDFTTNINEAILLFEKRLRDVAVNIDIRDIARLDHTLQTTAIKKEVLVYIHGYLVSTNEPCKFHYALYLGPLSTE